MNNVADNEVAAIFLVVPRNQMTMADVWAWAGTASAAAVPRIALPGAPISAAPASSRHPDNECPICHEPTYSMHMKRHINKHQKTDPAAYVAWEAANKPPSKRRRS